MWPLGTCNCSGFSYIFTPVLAGADNGLRWKPTMDPGILLRGASPEVDVLINQRVSAQADV